MHFLLLMQAFRYKYIHTAHLKILRLYQKKKISRFNFDNVQQSSNSWMKNQIRCYKLRKIALGVIFKKTKSSKRKTKTSVSMIFNLFSQIPMHITFVKKNIFLVHISFWNYISGKMPLSTNEILYKYIYYWPNNTVCLTEVLNLIFTSQVFFMFL